MSDVVFGRHGGRKPDKPKPEKPPKPPKPDKPPKPEPAPSPAERVTGDSPFRALGNTDRSSFRDALSRTIGGPPPMRPEADAIYDALSKDGLTRLAAVMAWIERKNDTYRGYYPQNYHNAWAVKREDGSWDRYGSYADAAKRWRAIILGPAFADLTTLHDFIYRYAPPFENDSAGYVRMVADGVNALPLVDAGGPEPEPEPQPQGDVIDLIFGGKPYTISAEYGQLITWSCPGCYDYFAAYGLDTRHHWAYDVSADAGDGAPLYAAFPGTVVCAGTGVGDGVAGTGCAAFPRLNNYGSSSSNGPGAGRLEILHDDGDRSLIYGHVLTSLVRVGQRVKPGDKVAQQGGMNGSHLHCEGRYAQGTKIGDPRKLFPGGAITPALDTVPYLWDAANRNVFVVTARTARPIYQRADPGSAQLGSVPEGSQFEAVAVIPGNDGQDWYLTVDDGRVPVDGTISSVKVG